MEFAPLIVEEFNDVAVVGSVLGVFFSFNDVS